MNRFLWGSYGMYLLGGTSSVFFGAVMPELLAHYHVTYTSGGLLALLGAIGFIIGVPIAASCMKRFHYRFILTGSALAVALAQLAVLCLPKFVWIEVLVVLNGIGASALETAVASYIMELFAGKRAILMSRLEVSFGIGALVLPAIASGFIALHVWRLTCLAIGLFAILLAVFWQTISVSLDTAAPANAAGKKDAETSAAPVFNGNVSKYTTLGLFLVMILIYVGVEGSLNNFLPSILTIYLKTQPYLASLSASVFWGAMVLGRMAIGWLAQHLSYERYLLASIVTAIVIFLILTQLHTPWLFFAAIFVLGFALSAIYSITMVYANHTFPGMERTVTSSVTAFAGVGGAVLPAAIGYAMDHLIPSQVLWLILAFLLVLLISFLSIYFSLRGIRQRQAAES